ncbi:hypothetical protein LX32DRAFT_428137 [Colletotrichum zoysiae]|uniref:Uncharacterized protein n=1 Tax=Colletotrichum zoysiae TaxID=1216348 RepID=A0AAD9M406_9PEZI|nr:hypothetical protein LX32DRAFT_428137 [Colletotrichum zoysiae]
MVGQPDNCACGKELPIQVQFHTVRLVNLMDQSYGRSRFQAGNCLTAPKNWFRGSESTSQPEEFRVSVRLTPGYLPTVAQAVAETLDHDRDPQERQWGLALNQASPPLLSYNLPATMVHVTGDQEEGKIWPCFAILPNKFLSQRVWLSLRSRVMACAVSKSRQGGAGQHRTPSSDDIRDSDHWEIYAP